MLCQKCGLQQGVVHLEAVVFRQTIQEHLCELCAGDRKPGSDVRLMQPRSVRVTDRALRESLDPGSIQSWLAQLKAVPRLTEKQAATRFRRLARWEREAEEALFRQPAIGRTFAGAVGRLLREEDAFNYLVDRRRVRSRPPATVIAAV